MITAEEARKNCYNTKYLEETLKNVIDVIDEGIRVRSINNENYYVFAYKFKNIESAEFVIDHVEATLTMYGYTYDCRIKGDGSVYMNICW